MLERGAGGINLSHLAAEEPAHQVDIMRGSIDENTARSLGELDAALDKCFRIQASRLDQIGLTDLTGIELCLGVCVGGVIPAHEAEEKDLVRMTLDSGFRTLALFERAAERLVGEYMFACVKRVFDHPAVFGRRGYDHNCLDIRFVHHFFVVGCDIVDLEIIFCPVELLLFERAGSNQLAARDFERQVFGVNRTQTAQADNTDFDFLHNFSPSQNGIIFSLIAVRIPPFSLFIIIPLHAIVCKPKQPNRIGFPHIFWSV